MDSQWAALAASIAIGLLFHGSCGDDVVGVLSCPIYMWLHTQEPVPACSIGWAVWCSLQQWWVAI